MSESTPNPKLEERLNRVHAAVRLEEPDRVPILSPTTNQFIYTRRGHKMAQIVYDVDTALDDIVDFLNTYEPDTGFGVGSCFEGHGPMLELSDCKCYYWAGMPDPQIPEDSIQQFREFPTLQEDEIDEFMHDRTWTMLTKILPRAYGVFEPMAKINTSGAFFPKLGYESIAFTASQPEVKEMYDKLGKLAGMWGAYYGKTGKFNQHMEELGFPCMSGIPGMVPFDWYSNFIRGTMEASMDLYTHAEELDQILQVVTGVGLGSLKWNEPRPGRFHYIFMHKGMDGFLSEEHYANYYWKYFMPQVNTMIENGEIPYIFTEGPYNSRLEFLKQLPKGKYLVHFENVDMAKAKAELGDTCCIAGNFPYQTLANKSKQEVIDEAKRLLDVMAPGGGYCFDLDGGMYAAPEENVEALYNTIREYGTY
ncbi:MAG: uroporphyrinogen decarboxylase family protein [Coriobacteriales bacterium]|jgi:hypothetical protein